MSYLHPEAEHAAKLYLGEDRLTGPLGSGIDGIVYATSRGTAIKVNSASRLHKNELAVYLRLRHHNVKSILGMSVPQLLGWDNDRSVIEMSIVKPPYIIDFAKSKVDEKPDFSPEVIADWHERMEEDFGDNWPKALQVYDILRTKHGVYHNDLSPRNLNFGASAG